MVTKGIAFNNLLFNQKTMLLSAYLHKYKSLVDKYNRLLDDLQRLTKESFTDEDESFFSEEVKKQVSYTKQDLLNLNKAWKNLTGWDIQPLPFEV